VNRKRDNSQTPDWNQIEVNWARILCRPARGGRLHLKEALRANPLGATLGAVEAGVEQEADGALVEVGARVVGARVARRELGLVDEAAQLPQVDVRVRVQALRPRVPLLHRRPPPPPADPVPHPRAGTAAH